MDTFHRNTPRRVQIVKGDSYFKTGQFAYVIGANDRGGMWLQDRKDEHSHPGEVAYLVTKSRHGRGGALWFSANGIRFTKGRR